MKKIDWSKEPEIRWEKKQCPICHGPTGDSSSCYNFSPNAEMISSREELLESKTIEVNGELFPIYSKQCYFRKSNSYLVYANYVMSAPLTTVLASIDGVDAITVRTVYSIEILIADQFDDNEVKLAFNQAYRDFINEQRKSRNSST